MVGVNEVEMGQNNDFLPKNGLKTAFLSITILDHPTSDWAGTQIFKGIANFNMCFEKCGTSASEYQCLLSTKRHSYSLQLVAPLTGDLGPTQI